MAFIFHAPFSREWIPERIEFGLYSVPPRKGSPFKDRFPHEVIGTSQPAVVIEMITPGSPAGKVGIRIGSVIVSNSEIQKMFRKTGSYPQAVRQVSG